MRIPAFYVVSSMGSVGLGLEVLGLRAGTGGSRKNCTLSRRQGLYWIGTIPEEHFSPDGPWQQSVLYCRGQLELGENTAYRHWQIAFNFARKVSLAGVRRIFGEDGHYELTRSTAAESYVWKEQTAIEGTRFEFGSKPLRRESSKDWDSIWESAAAGRVMEIPSDVRVRCYNQICRIATRNAQGVAMERRVLVYWGSTGTGKSRTAWEKAGLDAYPKDPRTKWWDGYTGQPHVVIDEFRGGIDIAHLLRWFDRYPVLVETKGGTIALSASVIWITSNLPPESWYPDLDSETMEALRRRLEIKHFVSL